MATIGDQMRLDLARAGYSAGTQRVYWADARALVKRFMKPPTEIGREELVSPEEEVELAQRIRKGDQEALQHHPDQGARCAEAGTQRVFTQGGAGTDGQVDDLPLQHRIDLRISFVLFHRFHQGAASFREQIPGGSVRQRQREVHDPAGVRVYELQTAALQGNGTLHTAAVFAVAP